jgi:hypothetical protein
VYTAREKSEESICNPETTANAKIRAMGAPRPAGASVGVAVDR